MNRLQEKYQRQIIPLMQKEFAIKNKMAVPKIVKIIVNVGIGDIAKDKTKRQKSIDTLVKICGQKPMRMAAKKAVSEFRIREGDIVGLKCSLRGKRMYQFLDKLISIVLPRIRDFQGVKKNAFDKQANYNLGLTEQIVFPEVDYDTIDRVRGLEMAIVSNTDKVIQARRLLELMGMPFEK